MQGEQLIEELFELLEAEGSVPLPRPGVDGIASLESGAGFQFAVEHDPEFQWIHLHATVGQLRASDAGICHELLCRNHPGGPLLGASLAINRETDAIVLWISLPMQNLDARLLHHAVLNFVSIGEACRSEIEELLG